MFEKLSSVASHYEEINRRLMEPGVTGDQAAYTALMKEYSRLTPIVEAYRDYQRAQEAVEEARQLLEEEGSDREMRQLAQEQYDENRQRSQELAQQLTLLLLPRDPNDDKNVIVEIRGGTGGEEAALFAGSLYRMYVMYAERRGWQWELIGANETELGGYKEVCFSITGEGAYSRLKYESGVHRVQRVRHGGSAARGRRGGAGAGPQGPADRRVPFLGGGRPACEQDLLRHPDHPFAHRHGGGVPG